MKRIIEKLTMSIFYTILSWGVATSGSEQVFRFLVIFALFVITDMVGEIREKLEGEK